MCLTYDYQEMEKGPDMYSMELYVDGTLVETGKIQKCNCNPC